MSVQSVFESLCQCVISLDLALICKRVLMYKSLNLCANLYVYLSLEIVTSLIFDQGYSVLEELEQQTRCGRLLTGLVVEITDRVVMLYIATTVT